MIEDKVLIKVAREITDKTWGVTQQFLAVHDIVKINGKPRIDRIDADNTDGRIIAYIPVKDQSFHLAIYFDNIENLNIDGIGTEPANAVYFRATSDELTFEELTSVTQIVSTGGWSKGDQRKVGIGTYKYSTITIEPNPEPDEFEDKLEKLLDLLEQDKDGIRELCRKASGEIQVAIEFHNGNTMLGGPHLSQTSLSRLSSLGLSIDFDLYAKGNYYKEG